MCKDQKGTDDDKPPGRAGDCRESAGCIRGQCGQIEIRKGVAQVDACLLYTSDGGRFRAAAGVGFDDTMTGVQRCLRDYGLLK